MEIDCFWALVEESGRRAPGRDERLAWLRQELCRRPAEEIVGFQTCLDAVTEEAFTWEVWAAADHILGWCSDDGFTDFRLWLVGLGRDVFDRAVADPDTLAETAEIRRPAQEWPRGGGDDALLPEWECLDYVAMAAYALRTGGGDACEGAFHDAVDAAGGGRDPGREPRGTRWDVRDPVRLARRLPRLGALLPSTHGALR